MKLMTRDTDYAIRALCYIAKQKNNIISVAELVKNLKVPRPFLRKILQVLNTRGILESYKGQGGGFKLVRPAEGVFLVDLIEIFQGSFKLNECFFKRSICPRRKICKLKEKIDEVEKVVVTSLKSITLASIL